jgi:hypothetical protein
MVAGKHIYAPQPSYDSGHKLDPSHPIISWRVLTAQPSYQLWQRLVL